MTAIVDEQSRLLLLQQKTIRFYEIRLEMIRLEAEAELARIEKDGGMAGFAERIYRMAEVNP